MVNVYYKYVDTDDVYLYNTEAEGFTLGENNTKICEGKNVVIYKVFDTDVFYLPNDSTNLFRGALNTSFEDMDKGNTYDCTEMDYLFAECHNLESVDVSTWDVDSVDTVSYMFSNCEKLEKFDMSKGPANMIINSSYMFNNCVALKEVDLSGLKYSRYLRDMRNMFYGCTQLKYVDLSMVRSSVLRSLNAMFRGCTNLECVDISGVTVISTGSFSQMFYDCSNLSIIKCAQGQDWSTLSGTNAFYGCTHLYNFDPANVGKAQAKDAEDGYFGDHFKVGIIPGSSIQRPFGVSEIDVLTNEPQEGEPRVPSNDPTGDAPFKNKPVFIKLYNDKFILPKDCSGLFHRCTNISFNDFDKWLFWQVENAGDMFSNSTIAEPDGRKSWWSPYDADYYDDGEYFDFSELDIETKYIKNMSRMFYGCGDATGAVSEVDLSGMYTDNCEDMSYMFSSGYYLKKLYVDGGDTSKVQNMHSMFYMVSLDYVSSEGDSEGYIFDLSSWDTSSVTDMGDMFRESGIPCIKLDGWNTSNVTDMKQMFEQADNLKELDISSFDTSKADVQEMFHRCGNLQTLNIGKFDLSSTYNLEELFGNDQKLEHIYTEPGTNWETYSHFTNTDSIFSNCFKLPEGDEFEIDLTNANNMFPKGYFEELPKIWSEYIIYIKDATGGRVTTPYQYFDEHTDGRKMEVYF